jgi:AcrR family transcriptional regulator
VNGRRGKLAAVDRRIERGQATREGLIGVATELFTERGYAGTAIELVLQRARVSRGSLYHHFPGKDALFEAVLESQEARVAEATVAAARGIDDPLAALRAGCHAWLELARDPQVRQIVLIDAPSVVGWEKWREIDERHAFGILKQAVEAAGGERSAASPEMVAHVLLAALIELAMLVARADKPRAALKDSHAAIDELLDRLLHPVAERQ